jgi:hypothetical protein
MSQFPLRLNDNLDPADRANSRLIFAIRRQTALFITCCLGGVALGLRWRPVQTCQIRPSAVPGRTAATALSVFGEHGIKTNAPKPQSATTRANRRAQSRSRLQLARSAARSLRGLYQEPGARRLAARRQLGSLVGAPCLRAVLSAA